MSRPIAPRSRSCARPRPHGVAHLLELLAAIGLHPEPRVRAVCEPRIVAPRLPGSEPRLLEQRAGERRARRGRCGRSAPRGRRRARRRRGVRELKDSTARTAPTSPTRRATADPAQLPRGFRRRQLASSGYRPPSAEAPHRDRRSRKRPDRAGEEGRPGAGSRRRTRAGRRAFPSRSPSEAPRRGASRLATRSWSGRRLEEADHGRISRSCANPIRADRGRIPQTSSVLCDWSTCTGGQGARCDCTHARARPGGWPPPRQRSASSSRSSPRQRALARASYQDPTGDANEAPDISTVAVDDAGGASVAVRRSRIRTLPPELARPRALRPRSQPEHRRSGRRGHDLLLERRDARVLPLGRGSARPAPWPSAERGVLRRRAVVRGRPTHFRRSNVVRAARHRRPNAAGRVGLLASTDFAPSAGKRSFVAWPRLVPRPRQRPGRRGRHHVDLRRGHPERSLQFRLTTANYTTLPPDKLIGLGIGLRGRPIEDDALFLGYLSGSWAVEVDREQQGLLQPVLGRHGVTGRMRTAC